MVDELVQFIQKLLGSFHCKRRHHQCTAVGDGFFNDFFQYFLSFSFVFVNPRAVGRFHNRIIGVFNKNCGLKERRRRIAKVAGKINFLVSKRNFYNRRPQNMTGVQKTGRQTVSQFNFFFIIKTFRQF